MGVADKIIKEHVEFLKQGLVEKAGNRAGALKGWATRRANVKNLTVHHGPNWITTTDPRTGEVRRRRNPKSKRKSNVVMAYKGKPKTGQPARSMAGVPRTRLVRTTDPRTGERTHKRVSMSEKERREYAAERRYLNFPNGPGH